MRALLTGATGFIGAHVLARLLAGRCSVTVLDLPETLGRLPHPSQVRMVPGGLDDRNALVQATKGAEVVFHVAGKILGNSLHDLIEVNVHGTDNLLAACAASGVRRFVFVSSVAVYQPPLSLAELPITETHRLGPMGNCEFRNYGKSKIEAERLVLRCNQTRGIEFSILRPTTTYGVGQAITHKKMETFLIKILRNRGPALSREQLWTNMQWVHVLDLAKAIVQAGFSPGARNQIFTIAGAERFNIPTLTAIMLDILWLPSAITIFRPYLTPMHQPHLMYDITKARKLLSFQPAVDLRTGLSQILEDMRRNGRFPLCLSKRRSVAQHK